MALFRAKIGSRPNSCCVFLCPCVKFPFCLTLAQSFEQWRWHCLILSIFLTNAITNHTVWSQLCCTPPVAVVEASHPHCHRLFIEVGSISQFLDLGFVFFPRIRLSGGTSTFFPLLLEPLQPGSRPLIHWCNEYD